MEAQQTQKIRDAKILAISKILTEQHVRINALYDLLEYARRKIDLTELCQNQYDVPK
jgi:hypothetical protein